MIASVKIKNYKNYNNVTIPLSRVTLLGGRNNVGKSNFLEALFLLHDKFNPQMIIRNFAFRGINELPLDPDFVWGPIFNNYNMDKEILISIIKNGKKESLSIIYNPNFKQASVQAKPYTTSLSPQIIKTNQNVSFSYSLDMTYKIEGEKEQKWHLIINPDGIGVHIEHGVLEGSKAVILSSTVRINPNEDAVRFGELDIIGQQELVLKFLQIVEPRLKVLSTIATGRESLIYGDIGIGRKIPISLMGDGLSRLLSIVLAILTTRNGIVLIDEIENGVHYSAMPKIWEGIARAANEANVQVVATTHSYECLQAAVKGFNGEYNRDFSYVRLEKEGRDVVPKTFDYYKLATALENEWEVR